MSCGGGCGGQCGTPPGPDIVNRGARARIDRLIHQVTEPPTTSVGVVPVGEWEEVLKYRGPCKVHTLMLSVGAIELGLTGTSRHGALLARIQHGLGGTRDTIICDYTPGQLLTVVGDSVDVAAAFADNDDEVWDAVEVSAFMLPGAGGRWGSVSRSFRLQSVDAVAVIGKVPRRAKRVFFVSESRTALAAGNLNFFGGVNGTGQPEGSYNGADNQEAVRAGVGLPVPRGAITWTLNNPPGPNDMTLIFSLDV